MSEDQLYMYYDFNDSDMVHYDGPTNSARMIKYRFPHEGHYLVATQWYNKCLNQDTFFFTRITVKCNQTMGITTIENGESKLIGIYDMLGRPVKDIRKDEVLIYIYSDGKRKKIMTH
jgi:hypothetical protein